MPIHLDTGTVQVPRHPSRNHGLGKTYVGTVTEFNDTTPAEAVVFPSTDRRVLLVEPNTLLVVTGYNLNKTSKVVFRKVLRSNGIPAQGTTDCCPSITIAHTIRLHSVALPCWVVDVCNPIFVVKTPGSYEIDVVGDYADVVVTAMAFPMQEVNHFTDCKCETPQPTPQEEPNTPTPPDEPIIPDGDDPPGEVPVEVDPNLDGGVTSTVTTGQG